MEFRTLALLNLVFLAVPLAAATPASLFQRKTPQPSNKSAFKQGDILPEDEYSPAYNAPSQVKLENNRGNWVPDLFVDVSFLYTHADEEGLDLGTSGAVVASGGEFIVVATQNSKTAFQEFEYKPNFSVGIGGRFCEWTLAGEYTRIRQTTKTHRKAPEPDLAGGIGIWVLNDWFQQVSPATQAISATSIHSKWHLAMDLADLSLSRPFYEGRRLSISPSFGLRAAWIRQKMKVSIHIPLEVIANQTSSETSSHNVSSSWGLGPRAGLEADCLLGKGFRLQGTFAASLLYTEYGHVTHRENIANALAIPASLKLHYENYKCIRPIGELGLGVGWASYFQDQRYHLDISASYNFLEFWDQNMIRKLLDSAIAGVGGSAGNLNIHGLTLTARFDF